MLSPDCAPIPEATKLVARTALLAMIVAVALGCEGPTGPDGDDGNANVRSYEFTILASDWGTNLHYGDNNVLRDYEISPDQVGGTNLFDYFAEGGVVLAYVRPMGAQYNEWMITPHVFQDAFDEGLRLEFIPPRASLMMSRTTTGWNHLSLPDDEIPSEMSCRIVLMDSSVFETAKSGPSDLDLSTYAAAEQYFGLRPITSER